MLIKTLFIVPCFLIGSLTLFNSDKVSVPSTNHNPCETIAESVTVGDPEIVSAVIYNNEIIPSVELNEVTIKPKIEMEDMVKATKVGNEIIPIVELKEVVIRPT